MHASSKFDPFFLNVNENLLRPNIESRIQWVIKAVSTDNIYNHLVNLNAKQ